jgi:hypothetical protein
VRQNVGWHGAAQLLTVQKSVGLYSKAQLSKSHFSAAENKAVHAVQFSTAQDSAGHRV